MLDVGKVDDARSGYYEGKAFLNDRIAEEDLIIKNIMDVKGAEKKSGYKQLGRIPERKIDRAGLGGGYEELEPRKNVVEVDGVIKKIMGETGMKIDEIINLAREKMVEQKGLLDEKGAIYLVGKELGVGVSEGKDVEVGGGDGNVLVPFDVRQIKKVSAMAVLVELFDKKGDLWIPKSCIGDGDIMDLMEKGVKTMLRVKNWFLEKKGLI